MRLHEALLCVLAVLLPFVALVVGLLTISNVQWLWLPPLATLPISLALVWLVGWMVDHTYG